MKITSRKIAEWADLRNSQAELPLIIRRLISATSKLSGLSFPAGDAISRPGWDGYVKAIEGNAWVPENTSCWELGCNKQVKSKIDGDYDKRVKEISAEERQKLTFIFVTPRVWQNKLKWISDKKKQNDWHDVRVFDADDLEIWLDNAPSVALEFAENLGITGQGVQSVFKYWRNWSTQTKLPITIKALLAGRKEAKEKFLQLILESQSIINIEADSREEASAFACAALFEHNFRNKTLCITEPNGWQFVETNSDIKIVISALGENNALPKLDGVTVVNSVSHGDCRGGIGKQSSDCHLVIPRVQPDEFENALIDLGEESTDARRLCSNTGRSWSVYRRRKAQNPLMCRPKWFDANDSSCLAIITLVGAWSEKYKGDKACLEAIYGKSYNELEAALRALSQYDDSPVIQIGHVWKAKSPLELTYLYCPQIPSEQYKAYFKVVQAILTKPDPAFELPEDDRWMANIYGKVREESGLVLASIVDSLIKLKGYAETSDDAISDQIINSIDRLIFHLFDKADGERWLSLSSYLPSFAEASPDIFLKVLEQSLGTTNQPVKTLITETKGSGVSNACWYSGLLWALETIAWNASKLARVTYILAELDNTPSESGWSNSPFSTLKSFYRIHWPQSSATPEQKIIILRQLARRNDEISWRLTYDLIPSGMNSWCTSNSRPSWRDDDAGSDSDRGAYYPSYLSNLGRLCLDLAEKHPERIAQLVKVIDSFEGGYLEELLNFLENAHQFLDDEKEVIRASLRSYLNWKSSDETRNVEQLKRLRKVYDLLSPKELTVRYRWLFSNAGVNLPDGERSDWRKNDELIKLHRKEAIADIYKNSDLSGLFEFIGVVDDQYTISRLIAERLMDSDFNSLFKNIWELFEKKNYPFEDISIEGFLGTLSHNKPEELLSSIGNIFDNVDILANQKAAFLSCLPPNTRVLTYLDNYPDSIKDSYWQNVNHKYRLQDEQKIFVDKFMQYDRFRSAFDVLKSDLKDYPSELVYEVLQKVYTVDEPNGAFPNGHYLQKAINYLKDCRTVSTEKLAQLEFNYFPLLNYHRDIPPNLKTELLSNPESLIELICLVYRPESQKEKSDINNEAERFAAETAWKVLHNGRGVPGLDDEGIINVKNFKSWVTQVRHLGKEKDRSTMTDQTIGQWLSICPEEKDGSWPSMVICELLEQFDAQEIRNCFNLGVRNNRGVTSRSPYSGGEQERSLAEKYRGYAERINIFYPQTASMLEQLAKYYENDAKDEDNSAQLRIEGH